MKIRVVYEGNSSTGRKGGGGNLHALPVSFKKCCVLKKNLHDLDNEKNLGKIQIKWTFDEVTEMKIIFIYVEKSSQTPPNNFGDASHAWNETFWPIFKPT